MKQIKKGILFIGLLISSFGYSQPILNGMSIIGKDTSFTASISTIRVYNSIVADLDACNKLADSLASEIQTQDRRNDHQQLTIDKYELQINDFESKDKKRVELALIDEKDKKRAKNRGKLLQGTLYFIGAIAICEAGYIGLQSIKK